MTNETQTKKQLIGELININPYYSNKKTGLNKLSLRELEEMLNHFKE